MARLIETDWPDWGAPALPPPLTRGELEGRLARAREAMEARVWDALVVYGDREHAANLHWLTGLDPRFEEAVLVVTSAEAHLLVGNECLPYAQVSPLVAEGVVALHHVPSLSLPSQPRRGPPLDEALAAVLPAGRAAGIAGWKFYDDEEVPSLAGVFETPHWLVELVRRHRPEVANAGALFMHPGHGLRTTNTAEEIARLEFAQGMAARAVTRMAHALREGMTDFEAVEAARVGGLPLSTHTTFATGSRAQQGMGSPTGEVIRRGSPLSFNVAHWGSNICRAGWAARGAEDLPEAARDYVEAFAAPYLAAMSAWCAMMVPGTPGGAVWERMRALLPFGTFHVELNPGHLIGLDEWISSPVFEGSDLPLRSGMAMQMDVIPSHPAYGSTRLEDGYAIADEGLRDDLAARFPEVLARCRRRQAFMRDVVGLDVPDALLPLADTCGVLAPFLLAPRRLLVLA